MDVSQSMNAYNNYAASASFLKRKALLEPQIGQNHKISQVMEEFLFRDSNADLRLDTCAGDVLGDEYDQLFLSNNTD